MSPPVWLVRPARRTKADRARLAAFLCADPAVPWQVEVEAYVQAALFDWAFDPLAKRNDPRLLLIFERKTGGLVGVAAHERTVLGASSGAPFAATQLEVVAVALAWQGRRFMTGARASDVVMSAVMADVTTRVPPRDARVFAVVHEDNLRSVALLRRHGLVEEMSRPASFPHYRRLVTRHRATTKG